jgi:hypothetical protein
LKAILQVLIEAILERAIPLLSMVPDFVLAWEASSDINEKILA